MGKPYYKSLRVASSELKLMEVFSPPRAALQSGRARLSGRRLRLRDRRIDLQG